MKLTRFIPGPQQYPDIGYGSGSGDRNGDGIGGKVYAFQDINAPKGFGVGYGNGKGGGWGFATFKCPVLVDVE